MSDSFCGRKVVIIGFGLSGLLAFLNLVKNYKKSSGSLSVKIFEKSRSLCKGIAYSTNNIHHLLNVPAYRMGVIDEDREHFFKWLVSKGYDYKKNDFVPRRIFGIYLEDILESSLKIADQKGVSYEFINKKVSEIGVKNNSYIVDQNVYDHCILATGVRLKNWQKNFWNIELEKYLEEKEIHISGCGLTAFDAIISLVDLGYQGKIYMHSRSGKMPQMHKIPDQNDIFEIPLNLKDANLPLSLIFHKFVKTCRNSTNWRLCFDAFRPMTQKFWMALDSEKKSRFMRHCFRLWNIHRHRCPESQFKIIEKLLDSGRLIFEKKRSSVRNTIDCTGFDYGFESRLINGLIADGVVKFDDLKLGIISQNENFYTMGGLNFGSTFEITAVPDITPQAQQIAQKILNSTVAS